MPESIVLAIETSQREGGVALRDADGAVFSETLPEQKRHDDILLPTIDGLFRQACLTPSDLNAVGVSIGPGGFTGLRIAVSTAKMFALSLSTDLVAIPSSLVAAESCDLDEVGEKQIIVALASKRGSFWATRLAREAGRWRVCGQPGLVEAEQVSLDSVAALLGDRFLPETLKARCESHGIPIVEPRFGATACLTVTIEMLQAGEKTDPLALVPLYPRKPEAVVLWESRGSDNIP